MRSVDQRSRLWCAHCSHSIPLRSSLPLRCTFRAYTSRWVSSLFDEPQNVPAGIVESIAGLLFVWATYTVFTAKSSAWTSTLAAHLFAIAGFLVGIVATWSGTTPFNALYHRVMLAVFVAGLILAPLPAGRAALRSTRR
jgi:hypothetical protein